MYATGDTSEWERLSGKNCGYCAGTLADLREKVAAGRHAVGGNFEFEASGSSTFDGDEYFAWVVFIQHPSRALDESGELVEGFPETSRVRAQVSLIWDGAGWTVDGVDPPEARYVVRRGGVRHPTAIVCTAAAMTIGLSLPANADDVVVSAPGDDRLHARAFAASQAEHAWKAAGTPLEERLDEYKRSSRCNDDPELDEPGGIDQSCYIPPGIEITGGPTCEDGPAIAPLWFRYRASVDSAWSTWEMLVGWSCPRAPASAGRRRRPPRPAHRAT